MYQEDVSKSMDCACFVSRRSSCVYIRRLIGDSMTSITNFLYFFFGHGLSISLGHRRKKYHAWIPDVGIPPPQQKRVFPFDGRLVSRESIPFTPIIITCVISFHFGHRFSSYDPQLFLLNQKMMIFSLDRSLCEFMCCTTSNPGAE